MVCLAFLLSGTLAAQKGAIKLATVVPAGSIWDNTLKQMGTEWEKATEGRVTLTVFSGGSQGDEATVLRKMRLDALQAASLTVVGLGSIDSAFNVFNIPFFFESYGELNYVVDKLTPTLKKKLETDPDFYKRCAAILGPNQQGITVPDPTKPADATPTKRTKKQQRKRSRDKTGDAAPEATRERPRDEGKPAPTQLGETIKELLDGKLPDVKLPDLGLPNAPAVPDVGSGGVTTPSAPQTDLLDYLLGP